MIKAIKNRRLISQLRTSPETFLAIFQVGDERQSMIFSAGVGRPIRSSDIETLWRSTGNRDWLQTHCGDLVAQYREQRAAAVEVEIAAILKAADEAAESGGK